MPVTVTVEATDDVAAVVIVGKREHTVPAGGTVTVLVDDGGVAVHEATPARTIPEA